MFCQPRDVRKQTGTQKPTKTHGSVSRCLCNVLKGSSHLYFAVHYLFLAFKDSRTILISCFQALCTALCKGFCVFVLKENVPCNLIARIYKKKKEMLQGLCCSSDSLTTKQFSVVFFCLFVFTAFKWGERINYWSLEVSSKFLVVHVMICTN